LDLAEVVGCAAVEVGVAVEGVDFGDVEGTGVEGTAVATGMAVIVELAAKVVTLLAKFAPAGQHLSPTIQVSPGLQ
jgi:hypothetical protein